MARRRMFSLDIVDTDRFLDLPYSAQLLYFHIGMRADDEGFIGNPTRLVRMLGLSNVDLDLLCNAGFLIPFESGVVVVTHWNMQNHIGTDRFKPTLHRKEKFMLGMNGNKEYYFLPERKALLDIDCTKLN